MREVIARRLMERDRSIELARSYVERLAARVPLVAAAVGGSVARGDFNVWSDVDVVVVIERLPKRMPDRMGLLIEDAPPGVQPVGFTPEELRAAWKRGNRLVREAVETGVPLTEASLDSLVG